jgi:hypothetical protein
MIDSMEPLEEVSKDLRPTIRRLREGLTVLVEAKDVSSDWVNLIEASGVDCEDERKEHS